MKFDPHYPLRAPDLSGMVFSRLTVESYAGAFIYSSKNRSRQWNCICECGKRKRFHERNLTRGLSHSCGCLQIEWAKKPRAHGYAKRGINIGIHTSWNSMKGRCLNPKDRSWKYYGGRGITVCQKWLDFEGFLEDMLDGWSEGLEIDRIETDGNYEKSNCRWITSDKQSRNRRCVKLYDVDGIKMTLGEVAKHLGLSIGALSGRITRGLTLDRVFARTKYGKPL
jgi:hypothetical protein